MNDQATITKPKLFLCFATEDLDFVVKFFSRLTRLAIDIWDYSDRDDEIATGDRINDAIARRIEEADYFIPVISSNSVAVRKACIHYEVRHAVSLHKKCFPVVLSTKRPVEWLGAFELISDRKYIEIDQSSAEDFEEKICSLCSSLKISYQPDITDHTRLPLYVKLQVEIQQQLEKIAKLGERYIHKKMMKLVNQFNLYYARGQWQESLDKINYLLGFIDHEMSDVCFYYPLIVKGACELQLNLLDEAAVTFKEAQKNPRADENAYGGLGQVYLRQNKFREALNQYHVALGKCPPAESETILYNLLLTASEILSSDETKKDQQLLDVAFHIIHKSDYISRLEKGKFNNLKEQLRVRYLIALALFKAGDTIRAQRYLQQIYEKAAFTLSASYHEELSSGFTGERLHNIFKENGFLLPANIPVGKNNDCWVVRDGDSIYEIYFSEKSLLVFYRELSMIIYYADLLQSLSQHDAALKVLASGAGLLNDRLLYHHYANLLAQSGLLRQAAEVYELHLCKPPDDKQFLIEHALLLKHQSKPAAVINNCNLAIGLGMPKDQRECYYHGFAYYLSGKMEQARAYYTDAQSYGEYYSALIKN